MIFLEDKSVYDELVPAVMRTLVSLERYRDDDDEIAYFTVRWKTRELVLSTAPKTWDNTDNDSKNRKRAIRHSVIRHAHAWSILYTKNDIHRARTLLNRVRAR